MQLKRNQGLGGPAGLRRRWGGAPRRGRRSLTRGCQIERWWHRGEVVGWGGGGTLCMTKGCPPLLAWPWGAPEHPGGPTPGPAGRRGCHHAVAAGWRRRDHPGCLRGVRRWGCSRGTGGIPIPRCSPLPPQHWDEESPTLVGTQPVPMPCMAPEMARAELFSRLPASVSPEQPPRQHAAGGGMLLERPAGPWGTAGLSTQPRCPPGSTRGSGPARLLARSALGSLQDA